MLRNKSNFQISTLICLSSISICNLLIDLPSYIYIYKLACRPIARQRPRKKHVCTAKIRNSNRGRVFLVRSVARCYKQYSWRNELVVGQPPAGKIVSTEAEDIVGIHQQSTTGEDKAN
jgi:hypothetical protein